MSRWEPNAKERLAEAALSLYQERGYEQTTVAEIAERAGLTERTFFRYFADKREVLFGGEDTLTLVCASAIEKAPATATPMEIVLAALEALVPIFQERHVIVRQRQSVIDANPRLQEREMLKRASLTSAMADALKRRNIMDPAASLTANIGAAVFQSAFEQWVGEAEASDLSRRVRAVFQQLQRIIAGIP
jgi:AcrR family transcriptional regulator